MAARTYWGTTEVLGWPKTCELIHASLWEFSYNRLKLAQLLGQLGVFLALGFGRIVALYHRSSASYHMHFEIWCLYC
jgi:hypothetical protein